MKALILFADGFEEIEAFSTADILRRAGVDVITVGVTSTIVEGAHKIKFMADKKITDINPDLYDALILPGGSGYRNLLNSEAVIKLIKSFEKYKKIIGAICASPAVLAKAGIMDDKIGTIYPGMESSLPKPRDAKVIVAGNVITARSVGVSFDFAFKLAEILAGKSTAKKVRDNFFIE